jgi:ribosomal protein L24E
MFLDLIIQQPSPISLSRCSFCGRALEPSKTGGLEVYSGGKWQPLCNACDSRNSRWGLWTVQSCIGGPSNRN